MVFDVGSYDRAFHLTGARKQKERTVAKVQVSSQKKSPILGFISYRILNFLLTPQAENLMNVGSIQSLENMPLSSSPKSSLNDSEI